MRSVDSLVQLTMATEMMKNNPGMMSMMENMIGNMSQEQLDAMVRYQSCSHACVLSSHVCNCMGNA